MQAGVRGFTSVDQVSFFSDKEKKLIEGKKWPLEYEEEVDVSKVNLDVISIWIQKRITELLGGIEDDIVVDYCKQQLNPIQDASDTSTSKKICPKKLQINLTGFLAKNAAIFVKELWSLLLSAQNTPAGIPQQLIDDKTVQLLEKQEEVRQVKEALDKALEYGDDNEKDKKKGERKRSVSPSSDNRGRSISRSNDRRRPVASRWTNESPSRRRRSYSVESKDKRLSSGNRSPYPRRRRSRSPPYKSPPSKYRDQRIMNRVNRRPPRSPSRSPYHYRNSYSYYKDYRVAKRPSPRKARRRSDSVSMERSAVKKRRDHSPSPYAEKRHPSSVVHSSFTESNDLLSSERVHSTNIRQAARRQSNIEKQVATIPHDKRFNHTEKADSPEQRRLRSRERKLSLSPRSRSDTAASESPPAVITRPSKSNLKRLSCHSEDEGSVSSSDSRNLHHSNQEYQLQRSSSLSKVSVGPKDSSRSPSHDSKSPCRSKAPPSVAAVSTKSPSRAAANFPRSRAPSLSPSTGSRSRSSSSSMPRRPIKASKSPSNTRILQRSKVCSRSPSHDRVLDDASAAAIPRQKSISISPPSKGFSKHPRNRILNHHSSSRSPPCSRSNRTLSHMNSRSPSCVGNSSRFVTASNHRMRDSYRSPSRERFSNRLKNFSRSPVRNRFPRQSKDLNRSPRGVSLRHRSHSKSPPFYTGSFSMTSTSRNQISNRGYQQYVESNSKETAIQQYNRRGNISPPISYSRRNHQPSFRGMGDYEERRMDQMMKHYKSVERNDFEDEGRRQMGESSFVRRGDSNFYENERSNRLEGGRGGGGGRSSFDESLVRRHRLKESRSPYRSVSPQIQRTQKVRQQLQHEQQHSNNSSNSSSSSLDRRGESHYLTRPDRSAERSRERSTERLKQHEHPSLEGKSYHEKQQNKLIRNDLKSPLLSPIETSKYTSPASYSGKAESKGPQIDRYAGRCYMDHVDEPQQQSRSIVGIRSKQQQGGDVLNKRRNSSPLQMATRNYESQQQNHSYYRDENNYKKQKLQQTLNENHSGSPLEAAAVTAVADKELQLKMKAREVLKRKAN